MTLRLDPDNPRRLRWRERPAFPLGSTEHYGALLNARFDYERYLATVAADRLSLTRIFGFYRELEDALGGRLGRANTLAPGPDDYLAPWARAAGDRAPGGIAAGDELGPDGRPRFDLERWDERYFARLRDFVAAADRHGVVVELTLFCNPYGQDAWQQVPLHPASNVNGVGRAMRIPQDYMTLRDRSVFEQQRRYVRRVVDELNGFDNLYYEICNEPTYHRGPERSGPAPELLRDWQREIAAAIREAEAGLPKRHLIAVNPHLNLPVAGEETRLDDGFYRHDPLFDLLTVHYVSQREPRAGLRQRFAGGARFSASYRLGSIAQFVALREPLARPISFDEDYTGVVHDLPVQVWQNRMEGWESLIGGCCAYDHLDFTFTPDDPTGAAAGSIPAGLPRQWLDGRELRRQLGHLADYAASLDLAALRPDLLAVAQTPASVGAVAARVGEALAVYAADARPFDGGFGGDEVGGALWLTGLAPGRPYTARTLAPATGAWRELGRVAADDGALLRVELPLFREDLLLHLEPEAGPPAPT